MAMLFPPGGAPIDRNVAHEIAEQREAEVARHAEQIRQLHEGEPPRRGIGAKLRSLFRR